MLWTICVILFVLWLLGAFGGVELPMLTLGNGGRNLSSAHLLLILLVVVLIFAVRR